MAKSGKSKAKATKTFLKKGLLDGQIKNRHKARDFKQKVQGRAVKRNKGYAGKPTQDEEEEEDEDAPPAPKSDDDDSDDEPGLDAVMDGEGMEDDEASDLEDDDLSGLDSSDETPASNAQHIEDLKALALKDPEFFKYLQENDAELLDFDGEGSAAEEDDASEGEDASDDGDSDVEMDEPGKKGKGKGKEVKVKATPVLTKEILRSWQKSLLETRSIRSLRKLLLAFRCAASTGGAEKEGGERWEIQSATVFNKLIVTTLKYTPVVLSHIVPYKESNGKFKLSSNTKQYATAQRLIKSYFVSLQALLNSVASDSGIPALAVSESAKLVPWIVGNRKVARGWVKLLLGVYDSAADEVRVAAFIALRKLAVAADHSLRESVLKGVYATLLASFRQTSIYSLPTLNLMKNSASALFVLPGKQEAEMSYQLTFGYIRMLAILLRKGVKEGSKDAFKSVYNWQFVHAIDFWSLVLSEACDKERVQVQGQNPLHQLLYPLIQVALGAIRLVPTSRYYPLRFHLVRSLLRIVQRTGTYIPLSTPLFEILDSPDLSKRSKPSTLKPLDWEYYIRCPAAYLKTRVYADGLADELVYLLTEYYGSLATSIAFPELVLPAIVSLKRHAKKTGQARLGSQIKVLVEKLEGNAKWIEDRREKIEFAPNKRDKVDRFLQGDDGASAPLGAHLRLQKKMRDQKRVTLEKAAQGEGDDL
ncbi:nucleolar complex protein 2, partial [Phenoliferia sp. Uapishka_3]